MKKHNFIKTIIASTVALMLLFTGKTAVLASEIPYICYNYDYREDLVYTPAAYEPDRAIDAVNYTYEGEPLGAFSGPQDICKSPDGNIYIADTGNNRIVVFDQNFTKVLKVITEYEAEGKNQKFKTPTGIAVSEENKLYVADSKNKRIDVFDINNDYAFVKYIKDPTSEVLGDEFLFNPLKVAVDYANRVYCIAQGQFEGIMVFDSDGNFTGFFGTIEVKISAWQKFWRRLASKAERENSQLFIPTEFTGLDIDESGFVYATNIDSEGIQGVRRLNPKGEDVIKKGENGNLGGDLQTDGSGNYAGVSQFKDVVYRGHGIYSCLDVKRGRIFTYDHEGNLLYVFGGLGTQEGTFSSLKGPIAIEAIGDEILVVDPSRNQIMLFKETEYGNLINEAVSLRYDGDEEQAIPLWERVLELDENNELANTGIGKAYLTAGDYVNAMKYLRLGNNRTYYSIAFRRYRNNILKNNIGYILTAVLVLVIGLVIYKKIKKRGVKSDE